MKFCPNMTTITFSKDENGNSTSSSIPSEELCTNESYALNVNMHRALTEDNLEMYKILFDKYINNSEMCDYFTYDEEGPASDHHHSIYPSQSC